MNKPPPELTGRIAALIRDTLQVEVPTPDTDLMESGVIDSLALVSLLTEIEHELNVELPLEELDVERFRSVHEIAAFLVASDLVDGSR